MSNNTAIAQGAGLPYPALAARPGVLALYDALDAAYDALYDHGAGGTADEELMTAILARMEHTWQRLHGLELNGLTGTTKPWHGKGAK